MEWILHLVTKLPAFYEAQSFMALFKISRHLSTSIHPKLLRLWILSSRLQLVSFTLQPYYSWISSPRYALNEKLGRSPRGSGRLGLRSHAPVLDWLALSDTRRTVQWNTNARSRNRPWICRKTSGWQPELSTTVPGGRPAAESHSVTCCLYTRSHTPGF